METHPVCQRCKFDRACKRLSEAQARLCECEPPDLRAQLEAREEIRALDQTLMRSANAIIAADPTGNAICRLCVALRLIELHASPNSRDANMIHRAVSAALPHVIRQGSQPVQ